MLESRLPLGLGVSLEDLNPAQRDAVFSLDGPCLVLAGAGSGKTRVITAKIAHLIGNAGYSAGQIAALTFTNKAAREMSERVSLLIDKSQARGLIVSTFHSLGVRILREEAKHLGLKPRFSILDASDSFTLLQELCASSNKKLVRKVGAQISLWKNAMVDADAANRDAASEDELLAARVFRNYQATLSAYQALDFDDLIGRAVTLFAEHDEVLFRWQSRLRYILIDEVQDTNACQYQLLRQLVGSRAQFTAVGDDDQAIYAWRGATLDNLRQLTLDYPNLHVVKLEQNYRSSGRILAAANALIANNPKLYEKKLWSALGPGDAVAIQSSDDEEDEALSVAIRISAHRFERRAKFADYAILYRGNHQARVFEEALRREKIPYIVSGGQSFFERAEIRDVTAWLRLLCNSDDDPAFIRAITAPRRGIGNATLETLGQYANDRGVSLFAAACESALATKLDARRLEPINQFTAFINRYEWRAAREPAGALLADLVKAIGYEAFLFDQDDARSAQARWQNVLDFCEWFGKRAEEDQKNLLEMAQSVAILNMLDGREDSSDAVRLSTLHAAKGLEFPHVFLVGCEEGLLPHRPGESEAEDVLESRIEEERRLMYVGVTRAQRSLSISWCKKRKRARAYEERLASRFIAELALEVAPFAAAQTLSPGERLKGLRELLAPKPKPEAPG
jgi:ATP-dependent DNA helicase Rep